jgi:HSP20 family molecular chaperone IbpA
MTDHMSAAASGSNEAPNGATFLSPADVFENKDAITMLLEMPGADPDSLNVTLERRMLTVSARSTPWTPQGYTLVHAEYRDGNYERAFSLSDEIDSDRIEAVFKDGVLRLTLPKAPQSQAKKIAVKSE